MIMGNVREVKAETDVTDVALFPQVP